MISFVKCDRCGKYGPIDAGSFICVMLNPETGKCSKYDFVCDECRPWPSPSPEQAEIQRQRDAAQDRNETHQCDDGSWW